MPQNARNLPLGVPYALLGLMFVWAIAYLLPETGAVFDVVLRPASTVGVRFIVGGPHGEIVAASRDLERRSHPPLRRGDCIVAVDGAPFRAGWDVSRRVDAAGPRGTL